MVGAGKLGRAIVAEFAEEQGYDGVVIADFYMVSDGGKNLLLSRLRGAECDTAVARNSAGRGGAQAVLPID